MAENSYQSAKRDALKAAAVVGVGYVAYKGYKKLSSASDEEIEGCFFTLLFLTAVPAIVVALALTVPFYVYWRARVFKIAPRKLAELEDKLENLRNHHSLIQKRLDGLPLADEEKKGKIEEVEKERARAWKQACNCASMMMTRLQWHTEEWQRQRVEIVKKIEKISDGEAKGKLRQVELELSRITGSMSDLRKRFEVSPLGGWFFVEQFVDEYGGFTVIAAAILWIPTLWWLLA